MNSRSAPFWTILALALAALAAMFAANSPSFGQDNRAVYGGF